MATIKKIGKEQAIRLAEEVSAEIIYDIIKLEGMRFTLKEVKAVMSNSEKVKQEELNKKLNE